MDAHGDEYFSVVLTVFLVLYLFIPFAHLARLPTRLPSGKRTTKQRTDFYVRRTKAGPSTLGWRLPDEASSQQVSLALYPGSAGPAS